MRAYYNENDPFAAAWLRNLIAERLITDGEVDTRSICDVAPADLAGFSRVHFFAGIGGWDYALNLAGWGDRPVWTGSCPCQPFSAAGKRKGTADARHLWPEMHRLISERAPPTVFGEQVAAKDGRAWLAGVRADLKALGYAVGSADICAAGIGAPHIRQRLYWVADAEHAERRAECEIEPEAYRRDGFRGRSDLSRGAHATNSGRELFARDAGIPRANTSELPEIEPWAGGGLSRVAHADEGQRGRLTDGQGREQHRQAPGRQQGDGIAEPGCADGGLGHADDERSQGRRIDAGEHTDQRSPWAASLLIPCADGKFRRVPANEAGEPEPALFPLAHGISNRVGTLRGAGNAIVPQVAAEFVKAFMSAVTST